MHSCAIHLIPCCRCWRCKAVRAGTLSRDSSAAVRRAVVGQKHNRTVRSACWQQRSISSSETNLSRDELVLAKCLVPATRSITLCKHHARKRFPFMQNVNFSFWLQQSVYMFSVASMQTHKSVRHARSFQGGRSKTSKAHLPALRSNLSSRCVCSPPAVALRAGILGSTPRQVHV